MRKFRVRRLLLWAFFWSVVIHFTAGPLAVWLLGVHVRAADVAPKERFFTITRSSAIKLEKRTRPEAGRPRIATPHMVADRPPRQTQMQQLARAPKRRELAAPTSRSKITVPRFVANAERPEANQPMDQQERMFAKTIERLRQENDPVLSAQRPVAPPQTLKRYAFNLPASVGATYAGQGILYPERSWRDGPFNYYYVRYYVEYPDGTTETGTVPWPLRYLPNADPFRLGLRRIPLPGPLPGYVLPPDTSLHPLVAYCYERRFSDDVEALGCPISHD